MYFNSIIYIQSHIMDKAMVLKLVKNTAKIQYCDTDTFTVDTETGEICIDSPNNVNCAFKTVKAEFGHMQKIIDENDVVVLPSDPNRAFKEHIAPKEGYPYGHTIRVFAAKLADLRGQSGHKEIEKPADTEVIQPKTILQELQEKLFSLPEGTKLTLTIQSGDKSKNTDLSVNIIQTMIGLHGDSALNEIMCMSLDEFAK